MGHQGPTVIPPWLKDVQFVTTPGTVFTDPQLARLRVDCRPLDVAVPIGPELRQGIVAANERVVAGGCAVGFQPHHLAQMGAQILGLLPPWLLEPFPKRHKHGSIPGEHHPGAKVQTTWISGQLTKDDGDLLKGCFIGREPPTSHGGGVGAVGGWFAIGQPEQAVACKCRIHGHVQ